MSSFLYYPSYLKELEHMLKMNEKRRAKEEFNLFKVFKLIQAMLKEAASKTPLEFEEAKKLVVKLVAEVDMFFNENQQLSKLATEIIDTEDKSDIYHLVKSAEVPEEEAPERVQELTEMKNALVESKKLLSSVQKTLSLEQQSELKEMEIILANKIEVIQVSLTINIKIQVLGEIKRRFNPENILLLPACGSEGVVFDLEKGSFGKHYSTPSPAVCISK